MEKRILYERGDGTVVVVSPAPGVPLDVVTSTLPTNNYITVDLSAMPPDDLLQYFVTSLQINNRQVTIDLEKARAIAKQYLRRYRNSLFAQNDIKLRDAMISGNQQQIDDCVRERDRLRDLPAMADGVATATELKQLIEKNYG